MTFKHLDHPGDFHWWKGHGPAAVLGPCPHTDCRHEYQSTIAWGPDMTRYELVQCEADCHSTCRAWTDGGPDNTTPWLHTDAPDLGHLEDRVAARRAEETP